MTLCSSRNAISISTENIAFVYWNVVYIKLCVIRWCCFIKFHFFVSLLYLHGWMWRIPAAVYKLTIIWCIIMLVLQVISDQKFYKYITPIISLYPSIVQFRLSALLQIEIRLYEITVDVWDMWDVKIWSSCNINCTLAIHDFIRSHTIRNRNESNYKLTKMLRKNCMNERGVPNWQNCFRFVLLLLFINAKKRNKTDALLYVYYRCVL